MIQQESPDQSLELATSIGRALTSNKIETIKALFNAKVSKNKINQILAAMEQGKTIAFDIIEMHGKIKVPRYECVIDFKSNEVHVIMKNNKHEYAAYDFKVIK